MRVRTMLRVLSVFSVIGIVSLLSGTSYAQAAAAQSDLSATVTSKDPKKTTLRLVNTSATACQLATTATGTVAITKVLQGGKIVQPLANDSASDEDIGYLLQSQLKTLQPKQSATLSLPVYKVGSSYILRATTWSDGAGSFTSEYPISVSEPLKLELGYNLPITPSNGAPACSMAFASNTGQGMDWPKWALIGGGILVVFLVIFLVIWGLRKRPRQNLPKAKIAIVVLLIASIGLSSYQAPHAYATDIVIPPELQSTYDGCISVFMANRDITGPILDLLNNPANHFTIVHTTTAGSDMTGRPAPGGGGIFTIYWNPADHHRYAGTGGFPDPCTVLYHELYHALDQLRGTFSRTDCAGSGIETKEVMATRAENELRVRLGLPPRSHYGDRPLPSGSCTAGPRPASCTGEHCGDTTGDPHLTTFDGLRYDFQGAGEFVAARDTSGDFEAQVRQQPWNNSRQVTINTAVAFKIDGDRVEMRAGQVMILLVNGKKQALSTATLPGGGQVAVDQDQGLITLTWKNGSIAYIQATGTYGLSMSLQPADTLSSKLEGLLGDANGDTKNDLHARGSNKSILPTYPQLYPAFADSWRISSNTSLFTYDNGKNTDSYTIHNFPDKPVDPKTLPGYAAAELFCKDYGISDPVILANCVLDMTVTGRPEFALSALQNQTFTASSSFNGTTWQLNIAHAGDSASVTFDGTAGEKIFAQISQTTLPSECGTFTLTAPDGSQVTNGCIINGAGSIDGTILPATGTYTIGLAPNGPTGTATLRLLRIKDIQGTITPNGPSVTANISQPGVVARYNFTAQAGQRVYVAVPSSTLDSECGLVRILDADGNVVANGCIINHSGYIDTIALADTGQYTLVLDPGNTSTGQAQLQLILPTVETAAITMDGSPATINLKKPGSIGNITFGGNAGQKVYVDIPSSELPSQCGILTLHAPDGTTLSSGCVINHSGNLNDDGTVLPDTGQYTLTLDPGAGDTGVTTIRLRSH